MAKAIMNPKVDFYFVKAKKWQAELEQLRMIALDSGLTELLKWGVPSYVSGDANIVLIHAFKEYCAFLFFKGALLKDTKKILIQQTKNVQAARQVRFTSVQEIMKLRPTLKAYIAEAIKIEKAGLKVDFIMNKELKLPEEFQSQLDKNAALKNAFNGLTPGRRRAYDLYFSSAKLAKTREERVQKYIPKILKGKGLDD